ncbi:predicted protein [Aspergillus terreus NIH2624]|uniref:Exonuclease domain-containing protein n=1 Tax=Aspergillus terreus (strain NIH 2624 / FGSC A1156) TaxID=341663 RepID=Q0C835_ASPTN|nr:uncharacterized protein ATEG_10149 [Aspergillus terreus NIH2624]EAU29598.1 predicted protein [Aspergillus terreus NIH2624]
MRIPHRQDAWHTIQQQATHHHTQRPAGRTQPLGASDDDVPDNLYDAIIVAIDFEDTQHILADKSLNRGVQVGLAILDTRDLTYLSNATKHCISTYNFAGGSTACQEKAERQFLFGTTVHIPLEDMRAAIEACMARYRNIILVGYDVSNDLIALRYLHFDFQQFPMDVIDTQWVAKGVGGFPSLQLRRVLQEPDCPYERLHCAGNDAHFALRALLLLAARACAGMEKEEHIRLWEDIARRPIHPPKNPKKEKEKRRLSWTSQGVCLDTDIWTEYIRKREATLQQCYTPVEARVEPVWVILLLTWVARGMPRYPGQSNPKVAFISDIASFELKPLFLVGSAITAVGFVLTVAAVHVVRYEPGFALVRSTTLPDTHDDDESDPPDEDDNTTRTLKLISLLAIFAAGLAATALILLSVMDTFRYKVAHHVFLRICFAGLAVQSACTAVVYAHEVTGFVSYVHHLGIWQHDWGKRSLRVRVLYDAFVL